MKSRMKLFKKLSLFTIITLCVLLALTACGEQIAATLDGKTISEKEISDVIARARALMNLDSDAEFASALKSSNTTPDSLRTSEIKYIAEKTVLNQVANEYGVALDQEKANAEFEQMRMQYGDDESFKKALSGYGLDIELYKDRIDTQILKLQVANSLKTESPTAKEIDNYVLENAKDYAAKRSSHILFASNDEAKAKKVLKKIKAGGNFTNLSKLNSIDTETAKKGGDVGWNKIQEFDSSYNAALEKLNKGEVSPSLVQTEFGWHIIKCTDVYSPDKGNKIQVKSVPKEIRDYLKIKLIEKKKNDNLSALIDNRLREEHLKINPMPSNLPYNVNMALADTVSDNSSE